ncbi:MAG: glycosyltransferase family 2 protein [Bacteroidota bacterium]|nr:glycosyltransferase family 2 protein [Bacteroidota bacterium]
MQLSVIFTTYNSPLWLEKVLWGYQHQKFKYFEVIIADDGSTPETANLIKEMRQKVDFPIRHVWHEDKGFRKCEILNKAILASNADYLVFSDGDCIPREDFLQAHFDNKRINYFLSGGAFRLPMSLSTLIKPENILSQDAFEKKWLIKNGLKRSFIKNLKLTKNKFLAGLMNHITPTTASWNGNNASAWKKDILAINGFDERMRYGSEDREFGERLMHNGIKSIQVRYIAVCIHLDHSRGYVNQQDLNRNAAIRKETKEKRKVWTDFGIQKTVE